MHTRTHNDRDHNLACVIAGRRRFVLFPPEQVTNLYVGPLDNPPPLSLVDPEAPDLARFPRYARSDRCRAHRAPRAGRRALHAALLVAPRNFARSLQRDGELLVGRGTADDPNDAFLTALLAFRDLPPGDRDYWREMIAAYVFADRGDVLSHIPRAAPGPAWVDDARRPRGVAATAQGRPPQIPSPVKDPQCSFAHSR